MNLPRCLGHSNAIRFVLGETLLFMFCIDMSFKTEFVRGAKITFFAFIFLNFIMVNEMSVLVVTIV